MLKVSRNIIVSEEEYDNFIKACFSDDWQVSEEDIAFAQKVFSEVKIRD